MELKDVSFGYNNGRQIISGLSLTLPRGTRKCIMGESGSGKTTLFKLILGLIEPVSGRIIREEWEKKPSVVFQEDRLLPWLTALKNVEATSNTDTASKLLIDMELSSEASKYPRELSGGMQRRVAIARALAFGSDMLLLDEPFKGLDAELKKRVAARVKAYADERASTLILITHDESESILLGCDSILHV